MDRSHHGQAAACGSDGRLGAVVGRWFLVTADGGKTAMKRAANNAPPATNNLSLAAILHA
jgi:hypothetical protein